MLTLLASSTAGSALAQQPAPPAQQAPQPAAATPPPAPPSAPGADQFAPTPSPLVGPAAPPSGAAPAQGPYGYPTQAPVYPPAYAPPPQTYTAPGTYTAPTGYPSAPLYGQPIESPGAREHDGFFLRMKVGLGAGGLRYKELADGQRVSRIKTRGLAGAFDLGIGGAVAENLILHGNLSLAFMDSHKRIDGVEDDRYDDLSSVAVLFGAGATYYFMPTNLYLTLVVGTSAMSEERYIRGDSRYEYDDFYTDSIESGAGFGTTLSVGKEWWVGRSSQWGLGVDLTGAFYIAPVEVSGDSHTMIGHAISVSFTATYN